MNIIYWFSAIFSLCGFYSAVLCLLNKRIVNISKANPNTFSLFVSFLAWAISSGLMTIILMWGYFTDTSLLFTYALNGAVGIILFLFSFPILHSYQKIVLQICSTKLEHEEKFMFGFIAVLLLMYLYRTSLPWVDIDETACYGYLSKLISGGRTFKDIFSESMFTGFIRSPLVQSWDALLYGLVNDTYLIRGWRLLNLLFCSLGIFTFLRIIKVSRFWSLAAIAGFLSIPELSYLALSLKIDSVVMMFELATFLSVGIAFITYWQEEKSEKIYRSAAHLSTFALLLAVFSFANRFTGIIPATLCLGIAWFFFAKLTNRIFASLFNVFVLLILFLFLSAPGYWINLIIYNNPLYPAKGFGPFENGVYTVTIEEFKASWNINGLPPVILQIYLIFTLGVGLELLVKILPFLNVLPMTAVKLTSMGWPYPLIFCVFLWPFFAKSNKILNLIVMIFIYQLICWSLGLHYSRLFVASTILTILAGVIMANQEIDAKSHIQRHVQKCLKFWIFFSLALSLLFQSWWFSKHYWGIFLFGNRMRYHAQSELLSSKGYFEKNIPTLKDIHMLNSFFLNTEPKPTVYVLTFSYGCVHIFFDQRIFIKLFDANAPYRGEGKYLLINPVFLKENPTWTKKQLLQYFPMHILTTPDSKWEVYKSP